MSRRPVIPSVPHVREVSARVLVAALSANEQVLRDLRQTEPSTEEQWLADRAARRELVAEQARLRTLLLRRVALARVLTSRP